MASFEENGQIRVVGTKLVQRTHVLDDDQVREFLRLAVMGNAHMEIKVDSPQVPLILRALRNTPIAKLELEGTFFSAELGAAVAGLDHLTELSIEVEHIDINALVGTRCDVLSIRVDDGPLWLQMPPEPGLLFITPTNIRLESEDTQNAAEFLGSALEANDHLTTLRIKIDDLDEGVYGLFEAMRTHPTLANICIEHFEWDGGIRLKPNPRELFLSYHIFAALSATYNAEPAVSIPSQRSMVTWLRSFDSFIGECMPSESLVITGYRIHWPTLLTWNMPRKVVLDMVDMRGKSVSALPDTFGHDVLDLYVYDPRDADPDLEEFIHRMATRREFRTNLSFVSRKPIVDLLRISNRLEFLGLRSDFNDVEDIAHAIGKSVSLRGFEISLRGYHIEENIEYLFRGILENQHHLDPDLCIIRFGEERVDMNRYHVFARQRRERWLRRAIVPMLFPQTGRREYVLRFSDLDGDRAMLWRVIQFLLQADERGMHLLE